MRVWLDTEFTHLQGPKLISIGMAGEDGTEFYAEIAEGQAGCWSRSDCSEFVVTSVLPHLESDHAYPVEEVARRVADFLFRCGVHSRVKIHADYTGDLYLVRSLLSGCGFGYDSLADWELHPLGLYGESVADDLLASSRHHHALDDARAYRAGRLAEEEALRRDFPNE